MFRRLSVAAMALMAVAVSFAAPPAVTLVASPATGISPLNTTLTWTSSGATSCVKSGAWSGPATLNGSLALTLNVGTFAYTLVCSAPDSTKTISWTAPTKNTDGTALTNLAGYRLYVSDTATGLDSASSIAIDDPNATSYVVSWGGTLYAGVKAINARSIMSDMSNRVGPVVVTPASAGATATVVVETKPNPPTGVVAMALAVELKQRGSSGNYWVSRGIGTIAVGAECYGPVLLDRASGPDYRAVDLADVTVTAPGVPAPGATVSARCDAI